MVQSDCLSKVCNVDMYASLAKSKGGGCGRCCVILSSNGYTVMLMNVVKHLFIQMKNILNKYLIRKGVLIS